MKFLLRWGKMLWPYLLLLIIEGVLFTQNYTPGTYVLGWDNLFPEFNFALNIKRSFFAVWQEYRGLGYQDGMSHAANLPHYLTLYGLSFFFPQNLLRYVTVFGTHLLGGIGIYTLIRWLFRKQNEELGKLAALIGGLVYQYSFATIQMFYLPFEPFMIHFAALPWLVWSVLRYAESPTKKNLIVFASISFLASPQAHVPTIFLVYLMGLTAILLSFLLTHRQKAIPFIATVIFVVFTTNAYWGLPFFFSTIQNSSTITDSKNNQMATDDIFLNNHKYGDFTSTALMRSFSLDYIQYDHAAGNNSNMFTPWRTHIAIPHVLAISWFLFGSAVAGVILIVWKRMKPLYPFVGIFLFSFAIIGSDVPVISSLSLALRTYVPLFHAVFRFVFTKFFTVYAFTIAILVSVAFYEFVAILYKKNKYSASLATILTATLIVLYTLPSFQGNFFYKNLRVTIPPQYFSVFDYFRKQDPTERIAILPAPWFWAWTQYRWSVITSGFQWFGIPQPTLDRAFDPWSDKNENFYWELAQTTYTKTAHRLELLAAKYNVRWFILDESIINASHARALYLDEIKAMLDESQYIKLAASFGPISIYTVDLPGKPERFISLVSALPNVGPGYRAGDDDTAFTDIGPYQWNTDSPVDVWYPFRTLFTGRSQKELGFTAEDHGSEIVLTSLSSESKAIRIPKNPDGPFYESRNTDDFSQPARNCRLSSTGTYNRETLTDNGTTFLRFRSVDASNCLSLNLSTLPHNQGYMVFINHRYREGKPLFVSITNNTTRRAFLETNLDGIERIKDHQGFITSSLVIPPMASDGIGYTLTLDNISIENVATVNDVALVNVYPIPYNELVHLRYSNPDTQPQGTFGELSVNPALPRRQAGLSVDHPNPAYYRVSFQRSAFSDQPENTTLILSQSFDNGWVALTRTNTFPYFSLLNNHVLVNNWENGWKLSAISPASPAGRCQPSAKQEFQLQAESCNLTAILFFLPQLLEWIGFALLPIPFLYALRPKN